jgi:hypothetical protein
MRRRRGAGGGGGGGAEEENLTHLLNFGMNEGACHTYLTVFIFNYHARSFVMKQSNYLKWYQITLNQLVL